MEEKTLFKVKNADGNDVECEVLFTFEDQETKKNYMLYTDYSLDDFGGTKVYAAIYDPDEDSSLLSPIETEEEWNLIEELLNDLQNQALVAMDEDEFFDSLF